MKWCPLDDELLTHATWLSFEDRLNKSFLSVEYFVHKYPDIFHGMDMNRLEEQFLNYQLLAADEIPKEVKEGAGLQEDDPYRVDILWGYLRNVKKPGTNSCEFGLLFRVAEAILTMPHSNAGEERIFSLINKNKTSSRSSLQIDGTLSSLVVVKTHIEDPLTWKPPKAMVEKAKKATKLYNNMHGNR